MASFSLHGPVEYTRFDTLRVLSVTALLYLCIHLTIVNADTYASEIDQPGTGSLTLNSAGMSHPVLPLNSAFDVTIDGLLVRVNVVQES